MTRLSRTASILTMSLLAGCFNPEPDIVGTDEGSSTGGSDGSSTGSGGTTSATSTTSGADTSASSTGSTSDDPTTDTTSGDVCDGESLCVPTAPEGWSGPVVVVEAADPAMLPECTGAFAVAPIDVHDDPQGADAACSPCGCGTPEGVECNPPNVQFWGNSNCNGAPGSTFALDDDGMCTVFAQPIGAYGAASDPVTAVMGTGSCAPSGGEPMVMPPTWGSTLRACGAEALPTCDGGVCAPLQEGFDAVHCIHRTGDVSCPPGAYLNRTIWYTDFDDARGCSACECTAPGGASCDADIHFFFDATCTDAYVDITNPGQECITLWGEPPDSGIFEVAGTVGGSCGASGGEPEGELTAASPVTVCCTG